MRNPNGYGSVIKLSGNRRKPWACRLITGYELNEETGKVITHYKYLSYHATKKEATYALAEYNEAPFIINNYTFKKVFELWNDSVHNKEDDKMHQKYINAFNKVPELHDKKIADITLRTLQLQFDKLELTPSILKLVKIMIKGTFEYAAKREIVPISALNMVKLVDAEARKEPNTANRKPFTREEIDWLWSHKKNKFCAQILVYIYTGMRFAELQESYPDNLHHDFIRVEKSKTKAGERDVPLSDKVKSLLPIEPINKYHSFQYNFKKIMAEMGSDHLVHDTRHTFISLMTESGCDSRVLKKIVGHASGDVTEDIYTHISMEMMIDAVNKI